MTTITNASDFNGYIHTVMSNDTLEIKLQGRTILMLQVEKLDHLRTYADDIMLNGMLVSLYIDSGYLGVIMCDIINVYLESEDLNVE